MRDREIGKREARGGEKNLFLCFLSFPIVATNPSPSPSPSFTAALFLSDKVSRQRKSQQTPLYQINNELGKKKKKKSLIYIHVMVHGTWPRAVFFLPPFCVDSLL